MPSQSKVKVKKEESSDPKFLKRFEAELQKRKQKTDSLKEAIRNSERLSEKDFAVRINTRG